MINPLNGDNSNNFYN